MRHGRDRFDVSKVDKPGIAALTGEAAQPTTFHGSGVRYASRLRQGLLRLGIVTKGQGLHPPFGRSFNTPVGSECGQTTEPHRTSRCRKRRDANCTDARGSARPAKDFLHGSAQTRAPEPEARRSERWVSVQGRRW